MSGVTLSAQAVNLVVDATHELSVALARSSKKLAREIEVWLSNPGGAAKRNAYRKRYRSTGKAQAKRRAGKRG